MKILVIEDEQPAAARLIKLLNEFEPGAKIEDIIDSVEKGILWFKKFPAPDLIFSDIQLADGTSFEIFEEIKPTCPVIFLTAFDTYAIDAFRVNSVDYLLKPIKKEDLKKSLEKFHQLHEKPSLEKMLETLKMMQQGEAKSKDRFLVKFRQKMRVVPLSDINYFYTDHKIVFLVTHNGERFPVDHKLEDLDSWLDSREFFRVNRQFIVRISAIRDMVMWSKSRLKLSLEPPCDAEVIVSSEKSAAFKEWLAG